MDWYSSDKGRILGTLLANHIWWELTRDSVTRTVMPAIPDEARLANWLQHRDLFNTLRTD